MGIGAEYAADLNVVNGKVVTPAGVQQVAISILDGRIVGLSTEEALPRAREVIDARGRHVLPGVVDPEAHPASGSRLAEVVASETRAAAVAGVTTWGIQAPSTRFGQEPFKERPDPEDVVSFLTVFAGGRRIWENHAMVDFFFQFILETDQQAEEIPRYARELGVSHFKFYLHQKRILSDSEERWVARRAGLARGFDDGTVYLACQRAAEINGMIHIHPENYEIARVLEKRLVDAGRNDIGAWDDRSPWFTEAHHVRSYAYLAKVTGCAMYVQHTTNPLTLYEIQRARSEGIRLYAQTGSPWLYFTRDDWRLNTPLRSRDAIDALWVALRDGVIDLVGSDHVVPMWSREEIKAESVWSPKWSGFASRVEMLLPILLHEGVNGGRISLQRLVEVTSETPAKLFGLYPQKGVIAVGSDADLVIVDLDREVVVGDHMVHSRSGWTLLNGHTIKGWPVMTILGGRVVAVWPDDQPRAQIVGSPRGRFLASSGGETRSLARNTSAA